MTKYLRKLIYGLILGIIVISAIVILNDASVIYEALLRVNLQWILIAALCSVLVYTGRFLKWCIFLRALQVDVPLVDNIRIFLSGISMGITPGKVGEVVKSYLLKQKYDVDFTRTAATIVAERLTGVLGCMLLCLISLAVLGEGSWYSIMVCLAALLVSLVTVAFFRYDKFAEFVFYQLGKASFLKERLQAFKTMYSSLADILHWQILFECIVLSMLYWFAECMIFYALLRGLDVNTTFAMAVFILTSVSIGGGLSLMPGSIGALEGGMIGVLVYRGIPMADASCITLLHRFFAMWLYVAIGIVVLLKYYRKYL